MSLKDSEYLEKAQWTRPKHNIGHQDLLALSRHCIKTGLILV